MEAEIGSAMSVTAAEAVHDVTTATSDSLGEIRGFLEKYQKELLVAAGVGIFFYMSKK